MLSCHLHSVSNVAASLLLTEHRDRAEGVSVCACVCRGVGVHMQLGRHWYELNQHILCPQLVWEGNNRPPDTSPWMMTWAEMRVLLMERFARGKEKKREQYWVSALCSRPRYVITSVSKLFSCSRCWLSKLPLWENGGKRKRKQEGACNTSKIQMVWDRRGGSYPPLHRIRHGITLSATSVRTRNTSPN